MSDYTCPEIPGIAHCFRRPAGDVQVFRKHEFDTSDKHIPAGGKMMSRHGDGFHATGIFVALWIYLGENNAEGDASVGADISDVHVELQNSPE